MQVQQKISSGRRPSRGKTARRLALAMALAWGAAAADRAALASTPSGCAYDRPCVTQVYKSQAGGIFLKWSATENFSAYNVRWSRPGRGDTQVEVSGGDSGSFHLKNAHAGTTYRFAIQGCSKRPLESSRCSPWENAQFTTR